MEREKFIIQLNTSSDPESENENNTSEEAGVALDVKRDDVQENGIQETKIPNNPLSERSESVDDAATQTDAETPATSGGGDPEHSSADKDRATDVGRTEARQMYPGGESGTAAGSESSPARSSGTPDRYPDRYPERSSRRHDRRLSDGRGREPSSRHGQSYGSSSTTTTTATTTATTTTTTRTPETAFPYLYICPAGFLTVLLGDELAIEMTLDNTIRLVNNRIKATAAISSDGRLSCIHHDLAKVYQSGDDVEAEMFLDRRAKLGTDRALFASKRSCFRLAKNGIQKADPDFADISHDMTISVLYSSSGYGPHLIDAFLDRVRSAKYYRTKDADLMIWINGVKIFQDVGGGEVTVHSGSNVLRTSTASGRVLVETPLVRSSVDDRVLIRNAGYQLEATFGRFTVSDGRRECGFDHRQEVFIRPKKTPATAATQAVITNVISSVAASSAAAASSSSSSAAAGAFSTTNRSPANNTPERYDCENFLANPYAYYRYLNYHKLTCNSLVHS